MRADRGLGEFVLVDGDHVVPLDDGSAADQQQLERWGRAQHQGGARLLGWDDQIGSLEPGKQADVAVWRLDGLAHADIADPVAALVLGAAPPLELLLVGGRTVVERDHVVTVDEHELTQSAVLAHRSLLARASTVTCKEGTAS